MSFLDVRTEAFSERERRWVKRSFVMHLALLAMVFAGAAAVLGAAFWGSDIKSIGEMIFFGAIGLLPIGGVALFAFFSAALWKDLRADAKFVVQGKVTSVKRSVDSQGIRSAVRVGDRFIASNPLLSLVPGFIGRVQVGDPIETAFLARSRRTLYNIRPL